MRGGEIMFYIFKTDGMCVSTINKTPNAEDLAGRNETAVESNENFDIGKIQLVGGIITEV